MPGWRQGAGSMLALAGVHTVRSAHAVARVARHRAPGLVAERAAG
jgi:hypothetical protein